MSRRPQSEAGSAEGAAPAAGTPVPAYRADGRPIDRDGFYAIACDPRRSVVVEACAGAGKTWMLVSRVLRALLEGAEPEQILAITFTKKAAGEMRERLDEWLVAFSSPHSTEAMRVQALRDRGLAPSDARRLAPALGALHERVLGSGRSVEICTFHAWFSKLLRAAPLQTLDALGIAPGHELIESVDELWPELLRRFHRRVAGQPALRDDHAAMVRLRGWRVTNQWLRTAFARRIEFQLADRAGVVSRSMPTAGDVDDVFESLSHPLERLRAPGQRRMLERLAEQLSSKAGAAPRKQGGLLAEALQIEDDGRMYAAVRDALLNKAGQPRKSLAAPALEKAVALLADVQRALDQDLAHEQHTRMARLLRALIAEYAALQRELGLVDMADLERSALTLLGDSALAARLQERLDARIGHVLVDEFQDTNPIQWHALYGWLSGYAGAGTQAPGVFIVGDPKQSIYRFRGAEPRVFEQAIEFVSHGLGGTVLACDHTRRNAPAVLEVVNAVFEEAQSEGTYVGFRPHTTEQPGAGETALRVLTRTPRPRGRAAPDAATGWRDSLTTPRRAAEERLRRHEARAVAAGVAETLAGGTPPKDVMVLCRKRESLRLVADELRRIGVPHVAPEDFLLTDSVEAGDLVAVLQFVVSPGAALPLARALKSPIFGADDGDLMALAEAVRDGGGSWWRALQGLPEPSPALRRAREVLPRWIADAKALPPHDLLDRIVAEGDVHARMAAAAPPSRRVAALGAIDALLAIALDLDGGRYVSPAHFVQALAARAVKAASPRVADAVQLLTIHGAKGLEAPVVFLVDADPERTREGLATVLVDWTADDRQPRTFAFVASEARFPPALQALMEREWLARQREEMNSLYVALTRACRAIVVSSTEPYAGDEAPSWWSRLEHRGDRWTPTSPAADPSDAMRPARLRTLPVLGPRPQPGSRPAAAADGRVALLGQAMHRLLEWATRGAPAAFDIDAGAAAAAAAFALGPAEAERLAAVGRRMLSHPQATRFFDPAGLAWAGNEVGVLLDDGSVARIDRLVARDDGGVRTWWVLDYKLAHDPQGQAAYEAQLARYAAAVRRLQPGERVQAALIGGHGEVFELAV